MAPLPEITDTFRVTVNFAQVDGVQPVNVFHVHAALRNDTISASRLDLGLLGHGYVATAEPLLYDLNQLVHDNKPPHKRARLEPAPSEAAAYWVLCR